MAEALCGPANPLQTFQKQSNADRSLQQDHLISRHSSTAGFRSPNQNAGILDPEFEAFQVGFSVGPSHSELQPLNREAQLFPHTPLSQPGPSWASDFQQLQISESHSSIPQSRIHPKAPIQQNAPGGWSQDFLGQQSHSHTPPQQLRTPQLPTYAPHVGMQGWHSSFLQGGMGAGPEVWNAEQASSQKQPEQVFDEKAFEKAFVDARNDMLWQELGEDVQVNQPVENQVPEQDLSHLAEQGPVGADAILHSESQGENIAHDDGDDLARTAGQLLDSVKHDQSQKFQQSNFLALMRRLRDKEVKVEGDDFRETVQPLHPGGLDYPDRRYSEITEMTGAISGEDIKDRSPATALTPPFQTPLTADDDLSYTAPPPGSPTFEPSPSRASSPRPPPFSSLYFPPDTDHAHFKYSVTESCPINLAAAFAPAPPFEEATGASSIASQTIAETKAALPSDNKGEQSSKAAEDSEPPPPYTEGSSPLDSFSYLMAAAGGAASIITQVQQGAAPPLNTLTDVGSEEQVTLDLRGTRFTLSRDELLTLPEFVLLSLFPNGLLPDGHMNNSFHEGDVYPVDYDPASLQYMLEFFRAVAQSIPSSSPSPTTSTEPEAIPIEPMPGSARDMLQDKAGIIVLREDLDFYVIPPKGDIEATEMIEVKRAAGRALQKQDGIFSGLRRSEESGTTEQHLIEMLTAGGFNHDDRWGHRAGEPNKAVICSLALARLRTDLKGTDLASTNAVGMAQKLLLFWRKPARRCWWEGVELDHVEGVEGKLKIWIRRVWTLEMSVIGLR
ncbi:MAG: hypothetical protein M1834_001996 [Cirrosporium novae-zelandiae]|nr:MAG: hypothetical protein M1834_001996 [Cirrosporium novae-zelandiae]